MTNQTNHDVAPSPVAPQGRDERALFEAFISTRKLVMNHGAKLTRGRDDKQYKDVRVQGHWTTWQAARASLPAGFTPEQVAELVAARDKILAASLPAGGVVEPATRSAWWALTMGAAASLEDASHCLRDTDAKAAAIGAAAHVRKQCHALWDTTPQLSETQGRRQMTDDTALLDALEAHPEWHLDSPEKEDPEDGPYWQVSTGYGNDYKRLGDGETIREALGAAVKAHHGIPASPQDGGEKA